jgi:hypothetical protein
MPMEKVFALKDSHIKGVIGRYNTLHERVELIFLNKKVEWLNRGKEEVFRCERCKGFILPKDSKAHKAICRERKLPVVAPIIDEMILETDSIKEASNGNGAPIST